MPTYVYRLIQPDGTDAAAITFEIQQSIHDPPLTHHPETGQPVERVLCAPIIGRGKLGDAEIRNAGLTKFSRRSDGNYTTG
jgi:hypothetical protein